MIPARRTWTFVVVLVVLLIVAQARPALAQEEPAGYAQYPQEFELSPTPYEPPDAPPMAQYPPNDMGGSGEDAPPALPDRCDPKYGGCPVYDDDGCFVYPDGTQGCDETEDFVDGAADDAGQTTDTLNGTDAALAPAEEPLVEEPLADGPPEEPAPIPDAPPVYNDGPEQYPPGPAMEMDAAPAPPLVPRPTSDPNVYPEGGPEPPGAPPTESRYEAVPGQDVGSASQPVTETGASVEEPGDVPLGPAEEQAAEPPASAKDAPEGEPRGGQTAAGAGSDREAAPGGEEAGGGSRLPATTVEERAVGEPRKVAAGSGGASTVYTLGGSAILIAGVALAGRFLKR